MNPETQAHFCSVCYLYLEVDFDEALGNIFQDTNTKYEARILHYLFIYSQNIIKTNFMLARNWENVSKQNTGEFYLENLFLKRSTFYLHLQSSIHMNLIMNQNQVDDNTLKFTYSTFSLLSYL